MSRDDYACRNSRSATKMLAAANACNVQAFVKLHAEP